MYSEGTQFESRPGGLFNNAFSSSDCAVSSDMMINELERICKEALMV
jgi:hypothetical protein